MASASELLEHSSVGPARLTQESTEPEPAGFARAAIDHFAGEIGQRLGLPPGADLEPVVERLGGKLEYKTRLSFPQGSLVVRKQGDFTIYLPSMGGCLGNRFTIAHELGHYVLHSKFGAVPLKAGRVAYQRKSHCRVPGESSGRLVVSPKSRRRASEEQSGS